MKIAVQVTCFVMQIFCVVSALSGRTGNNVTDKLSLLEFKAKLEDGPLGLLRSWNDSAHFCTWPGVTCGHRHRQRVVALRVGHWQLKGQLSPHVGNLSFLRVLIISNNSFDSEIPQEIGRLFRLRALSFWNNSFRGEVPANISGCLSLEALDMGLNNLSGRIPAEVGSLSELRLFSLQLNNLAGEIPFSLGNLSRLEVIDLTNNTVRGTIPASLGGLRKLKVFYVGMNYLEGTVPVSLYNISTLETFIVQFNQLEGSLPSDLSNKLPNLQVFYLDHNNLSGTIPPTMSNASNLIHFQVSQNNFRGKVPIFKSSLNLKTLVIFKNYLGFSQSGDLDFLSDLANKTYLELLDISINNLRGPIPKNIGNMTSTRLLYMVLGENKITGNIPLGIGNLFSLLALQLAENSLTGEIPSTIGRLRKLNYLTLYGNKLSGEIPTTIGNLTSLTKLYLNQNNLQGSIPTSLGECSNLLHLTLTRNNLTGPIPSQVVNLSSLSILLDLSGNQLSGPIPLEVGNLGNLGILDISYNKLLGEIPKDLGRCASLEYLYLQGNLLQGSIPDELNSLKGVREFDLSRNNLSGQVPKYFAGFEGLLFLNLSFNNLEGQVPIEGIFKNVSKFSVTGNTKLCGGSPKLRLPKCIANPVKNHKPLSQKIEIVIIVCCVVVGLAFVLILAMHVFHSRKRSKQTSEPSAGNFSPRVSYGDLSQATGSFSSSNLIGVGRFGSVYKGILNQENTLVAVKVLNLHVSRALKSFVAECESLKIIKHRNLVKLITVCSSIDFQGNEFKALVYEFMVNGNLEEWLHSDRRGQEQSRRLNLTQRINISIDVASALDYLHNHCSEAIVHRDIKPSNILLDGDMVAHVGDFGLAKLLRSSFALSSDQTSSVGIQGTVGYVAPEYSVGSEVSTFGDIYSFGILLLEMFTGKRPTDSMFKDDFNLNQFASQALPDCISEIVDPILLEEQREDQTVFKSLVSIIKIGVACSSNFPGERSNIGNVVAALGKIRDALVARITPRNHVRNTA